MNVVSTLVRGARDTPSNRPDLRHESLGQQTSVMSQEFVEEVSPSADGRQRLAHNFLRTGLLSAGPDGAPINRCGGERLS